jgi:chromosome segregation ATPase
VYETQASALDSRSDAVQKDLENVRGDIAASRKNISGLESRIAPLQKEYAEKKCNNLVPGETEQSTIDRCTAIFSDWNRLQADLNRENNRVPELRSKYESLFSELKTLEKRANDYGGYLSKNCSSSPENAKMKNVVTVRENAQKLQTELDGLVSDITKLRGVKITITAQ